MGCCFSSTLSNGMKLLFGMMVLCVILGCYEHESHGNQSVYQFAGWVAPTVIGGSILCIPIGWLLGKWSPKWGFVLMGMAPILLVMVAPSMYSDRVLIDDEHFEAIYGSWFSPSKHDVRFRDLREIRHVAVRGSYGRTLYELHCIANTGQVTVVHAGDLVKNTVPEILARAKARGVVVVSQGR